MRRPTSAGPSGALRSRTRLSRRRRLRCGGLAGSRGKIHDDVMALAKTTRPTLAATVARPRLFRRLDRARQRPVTWVWGPPGAGKTTLVASYLAARRRPALWYQVDGGDGDVATFFYYLGQAAPRRRRPAPAPDARVPARPRHLRPALLPRALRAPQAALHGRLRQLPGSDGRLPAAGGRGEALDEIPRTAASSSSAGASLLPPSLVTAPGG